MKMLATKIALVTSVVLAPLFATEAAYAQRYHAAPQSYDAGDHSRPGGARFTPEEQRIIDQITRTDESAGQ